MFYLGLYPNTGPVGLAHNGCTNILAELPNEILELLFCFLERQPLSSLAKPPNSSERTCYKNQQAEQFITSGLHNVKVMD